jgi:hypothetical protein
MGPRFPSAAENGTMDDKERRSAFTSALSTEHYVLQGVASATINEAAARASLYAYSLSSSLVAIGFASQSRDLFRPLAAGILLVVFVLGVLTILRLVETSIENQKALRAIARIRAYYRTLTPEALELFSAENGRWPEGPPSPPSTFVAFLTTSATMIALTNSIVAGAWLILVLWGSFNDRTGVALSLGALTSAALMTLFVAYQRRRHQSAVKEV